MFHWHAQVHRADKLNFGSGLRIATPSFSFLQMPFFGNLDGINLKQIQSSPKMLGPHGFHVGFIHHLPSFPSSNHPWQSSCSLLRKSRPGPKANSVLSLIKSLKAWCQEPSVDWEEGEGHQPQVFYQAAVTMNESFNLSGLTFVFLHKKQRDWIKYALGPGWVDIEIIGELPGRQNTMKSNTIR